MTTILGIKAENSVVLASDDQLTYYRGDTADTKKKIRKLRVIRGIHAVADAGFDNTDSRYFLEYLEKRPAPYFTFREKMALTERADPNLFRLQGMLSDIADLLSGIKKRKNGTLLERRLLELMNGRGTPKNPFEKKVAQLFQSLNNYDDPVARAIATGYFVELDMLNKRYLTTDTEESKDPETLIVASRSPELCLYRVDRTGLLLPPDKNPFTYTVLGSGSELVSSYFDDEKYADDSQLAPLKAELEIEEIKIGELGTPEAICLAYGALKAAGEDIHTGAATDIVVVTKGRIYDYGSQIKQALNEAEQAQIIDVMSKFVNK